MIDISGGNTIVLFLLGIFVVLGLGIWALSNPSWMSFGVFIGAAVIAMILAVVNFN